MGAAQSSTPVMGYTVNYKVSNVLLTFWGPVVWCLRCERRFRFQVQGFKVEKTNVEHRTFNFKL